VQELQLPPGALELTRVPIAPVHDGGSLGHPSIVPVQSDTLAFGRSNSFSIARSGDLVIAQLLASAAPSAEHQGPLSYNERYKHYDRLNCIGHSFSFVTGA
jgi:hypothetical protein